MRNNLALDLSQGDSMMGRNRRAVAVGRSGDTLEGGSMTLYRAIGKAPKARAALVEQAGGLLDRSGVAKLIVDTDEISVPTDRVRSAHLSRKELPVDRNYSEEHQDVILRNDPEITNGRTTFKGTRVPVDTLIAYRRAGHPPAEWRLDYPTVARWRAEAVWQWPDEVIEEWIAKGEAIVRAKIRKASEALDELPEPDE